MRDNMEKDERENISGGDSFDKITGNRENQKIINKEKRNLAFEKICRAVKNSSINILIFAFSVVIALVIWNYVMAEESPEWRQTFTGVKVNVNNIRKMNEEYGLSVISESENINVSFTLEGKKSVLSKLTVNDINAFIDVGRISESGTYELEIGYLPISDVTIVDVQPRELSMIIDSLETKTVPVKVRFVDCILPNGYTAGECRLSRNELTVSGAKADLDKIESAVISLKTGALTQTVTAMNEIPVLCEKDGNEFVSSFVTYPKTPIDVVIPVFLERDISLTVGTVYGFYGSNNTEIVLSPSKIRVYGDAAVVSALSPTLEIGRINEKEDTINYTVPVDASLLGEGITLVDGTEYVNVSVRTIGMEETVCFFSKESFKINNPLGLKFRFPEEYEGIDLHLVTSALLIGFVNEENVEIVLDMSSIGGESEECFKVPLRLSFKNALSGKTIETGEYYADIILGEEMPPATETITPDE